MGMVKRFLGSYSENFAVALGLWPFMSLALTLPILAYLYHRDGRLRLGTAVGAYLTVLYGLGLVCLTLYPLPSGDSGPGITYGIPPQLNPLAFVGDLRREGVAALPQILANVVFFVPLGFIAGRLFRWGLARTALAGLAVSLLVETAQLTGVFGIYAYAYRTFDVDDLIYNTAGALVGWLLAAAAARVLPPDEEAGSVPVTDEPGFVRRMVALWIDSLVMAVAWVVLVSGVQALASAVGASRGDLPGPLGDQRWMLLLGAVVLVAVEGVVPALRAGRTPGGGFVRMTCETRPRRGWRRALFYVGRLVVLGAVLAWPFVGVPLAALFYALVRQMPYDLLP